MNGISAFLKEATEGSLNPIYHVETPWEDGLLWFRSTHQIYQHLILDSPDEAMINFYHVKQPVCVILLEQCNWLRPGEAIQEARTQSQGVWVSNSCSHYHNLLQSHLWMKPREDWSRSWEVLQCGDGAELVPARSGLDSLEHVTVPLWHVGSLTVNYRKQWWLYLLAQDLTCWCPALVRVLRNWQFLLLLLHMVMSICFWLDPRGPWATRAAHLMYIKGFPDMKSALVISLMASLRFHSLGKWSDTVIFHQWFLHPQPSQVFFFSQVWP
jgi:hypothetical protein